MSWRSIWVVGAGGRSAGLARRPGRAARGGCRAAGWPSRSGRAVRAVGVSVGVGVGVGFCAASSPEQAQRRDGEPRAEQHDQDGRHGQQRRLREVSKRPPAATNNRSSSSSNGSRALRASGARVTSAETPICAGRRRVLVVAQHPPVDRDPLGLGQAGERLGQVGAAAFADRGQRRFAERERLHADAACARCPAPGRAARRRRRRSGRCSAATRSPGPCAARAGGGARTPARTSRPAGRTARPAAASGARGTRSRPPRGVRRTRRTPPGRSCAAAQRPSACP